MDDSTFRSLFRMHRASFWQLVELLTQTGGAKYWHQPEARGAAALLRRSHGANGTLFECEIGIVGESKCVVTGLCIRVIFTRRFTGRFTKYGTQSCGKFSSTDFETL